MFKRNHNRPEPGPSGWPERDGDTLTREAPTVADEPAEPARVLTADEVRLWRSAISHAGHGGHVPDDVRGPLAAAFSRASDLGGLVLLARTRPDTFGAPIVEPGSTEDLRGRTSGFGDVPAPYIAPPDRSGSSW